MLEHISVCDEVFHTARAVAYADVVADGQRETWPFAGPFPELGAPTASTTGPEPLLEGQSLRRRAICSKRAHNLMLLSGRSACASLRLAAAGNLQPFLNLSTPTTLS